MNFDGPWVGTNTPGHGELAFVFRTKGQPRAIKHKYKCEGYGNERVERNEGIKKQKI